MDFGPHVVAIEIYPKVVSPYSVEKRASLLYDIEEFLGEKIERLVGKPAQEPWGRDMNGCMPAKGTFQWMTLEEFTDMEKRNEMV